MIIKVCGMRSADNIRAVEQLGVDWLGFIFWPRSSRYVAERPSYLPTKAKRVGVFVDATVDEVLSHISDYNLDAVQLHGHESPDYIRTLRSSLAFQTDGTSQTNSCFPVVIIKAISIATSEDTDNYRNFEGLVDYFLFDTKCQTVGGSGLHFDWSMLADYDGQTPFLLSGGIGPDDAQHISSFHHPRCIGIDLNSRFEIKPALKDVTALQGFLSLLSSHETHEAHESHKSH